MLGEIFGVDGIVVLVVVLVLLFGSAAIPKLARSFGSAKDQFEQGLDEGKKVTVIPDEASPAVVDGIIISTVPTNSNVK